MEQLKTLYLKYRLFLWPIVSGLACLIILGFLVIPEMFSYFKTQGHISDIRNRIEVLEAKAATLESIDDSSNNQNLQVVSTILPADKDVPQTMAVLQDIITKSGLILKNTNYGASNKGAKNSDSFKMSISVNGPISAVRNLLINLADAPQVFQVEAINIQFQNAGSMVEADIPIVVFYQGTGRTSISVDAPVNELSETDKDFLAQLSKLIPTPLSNPSSASGSSVYVPLGKSDPFE